MTAAAAFSEKTTKSKAYKTKKAPELTAYRVADMPRIVLRSTLFGAVLGAGLMAAFNHFSGATENARYEGAKCAFDASKEFMSLRNAGKDQIAQIIYIDDMARCGMNVKFEPGRP